MKDFKAIQFTHYKDFINDVYEKKKSSISDYSYRRFAMELSIASSTLSEILSGKHIPSIKTMRKIGSKLKLESEEVEHLVDLALLHSPYAEDIRANAKHRIIRRQKLRIPIDA